MEFIKNFFKHDSVIGLCGLKKKTEYICIEVPKSYKKTYINVSTVNGSQIKLGYIIKNIIVYKEEREIALIDKIILSFSLDNSNTPEKYSAILGYDTYLEKLKGVIL